jgi:hypothetical protein
MATFASDYDNGLIGHRAMTPAEDHELRQLTWFSRAGSLSESAAERLAELVTRDRRADVRDARPNPSVPMDEESSTLPPLDMDWISSLSCPNCGSIVLADNESDPSYRFRATRLSA